MTRLSEWYGPPELFSDSEIVRMLKLAGTSSKDVLCDLGCGHAKNLIVGAKKFAVRKCIGVEQLRSRCEKARERIAENGLSARIRVVNGDMDRLLESRVKGVDPSQATVVLYTIVTTKKIARLLSQALGRGCRLLYYAGNGVFPEIKPVAVDYPFFMSIAPFERPMSQKDWLNAILMDEMVGGWHTAKLWKRVSTKLELTKRETRSYRTRLSAAVALPFAQ